MPTLDRENRNLNQAFTNTAANSPHNEVSIANLNNDSNNLINDTITPINNLSNVSMLSEKEQFQKKLEDEQAMQNYALLRRYRKFSLLLYGLVRSFYIKFTQNQLAQEGK